MWGTIELHCVSKNLTHRRRPKKVHFLRILPKQNTALLSHVSQSVRDGIPRKICGSFVGAKLSTINSWCEIVRCEIVLQSSLKQHTSAVADNVWNNLCLVGLRALALSPVVSAVQSVDYNTNGQLTHERCTCSFAIEWLFKPSIKTIYLRWWTQWSIFLSLPLLD